MVDAAFHPRQNFYNILRSDSKREGDALTYYDYQRALRSKKVEILQQKRAATYEPGYKKAGVIHPSCASSRKVFQLKNKFPPASQTLPIDTSSPPEKESVTFQEPANEQLHRSSSVESVCSVGSVASLDGVEQSQSKTSISGVRPSSAGAAKQMDAATTERLPKISRKSRLIKSASIPSSSASSHVTPPPTSQRPKTMASTRDTEVQTITEGISSISKNHRRTGSNDDREGLCKTYQWGTATQRGYDEMKWPRSYSLPDSYLPTTTIEQFPDAVSQRLTFRRYNSEPEGWQVFGDQWDTIQTRPCDTFITGPQAVAFNSISHKTQQIPGYMGCIPGWRTLDQDRNLSLVPKSLVRTFQPRKTKISRRANIPGYAGQVHWKNVYPAHSNMPIPEPTTSARVHRTIHLEDELSPFRRDGVLSKMVTTVSPYNPFNVIQY